MVARAIRPLLLVVALGLLAACGPRAARLEPAPPSAVGSVYVVSDGWHATLVLPRQPISPAVWPEQAELGDSRYLEFGWGDKVAYVGGRITTRLALGAAFRSSGSALHVAAFDVPVAERFPELEIVEVPLEPRVFDELARFVRASYARDRAGNPTWLGPGYAGSRSAFFQATGRYHLFNTCNTWVARALRAADQPIVPALTLTAAQVMAQARGFGRVLRSGST